MKIVITIIAIFCVSSIMGDEGKRVEFDVPSLEGQLGNGASKNDELKDCLRDAGFNALDVAKRVDVAHKRLKKRLKPVTEDLSKYEECYHKKSLDETYLKWGQNYISDECLKSKITELGDPGNEKKLKKTIFAIDRTIMSFTKELKKRGEGREKAIRAIACLRYKSDESLTKFTAAQKSCFDTEISSASLDTGVDVDLLKALDDKDLAIDALNIDPSLDPSIGACDANIANNALTFEKDEEHYTLSCLEAVTGFEDHGRTFNGIHVQFHLAIKEVAEGNVGVAQKLKACYNA